MTAVLAMPTVAPPAYRDQAPAYQAQHGTDLHIVSSPVYSGTADMSERVLEAGPSSPISTLLQRRNTLQSFDTDFIERTEHMEVNLGPRVWGLRTPAYGKEGHVEGFLKLSGEQAHVTRVEAKVIGDIMIRTSQLGQVIGQDVVRFLRQSVTLYASNRRSDSSTSFDGEHRFSFALPTHVMVKGEKTPLPASYTTYLPSTVCEVNYILKVDMVRKGFRRHETLRIPISYLPKSRPSHPTVRELPWPSSNHMDKPFVNDSRVKCEALSEFAPCQKSATISANPSNSHSIYLSIPSPASFTSGEHIPFLLSLIFPGSPALPALVTPHIKIQLVKRVRLSRLGGMETAVREILAGSADIRNIHEPVDGVTHLSGVIPAGKPGREDSWKVHGMADVQYLIRVVAHPPRTMSCHLPSWKIEMDVQLSTDHYGTLETELIATGGIPMPALGLDRSQRPTLQQWATQ